MAVINHILLSINVIQRCTTININLPSSSACSLHVKTPRWSCFNKCERLCKGDLLFYSKLLSVVHCGPQVQTVSQSLHLSLKKKICLTFSPVQISGLCFSSPRRQDIFILSVKYQDCVWMSDKGIWILQWSYVNQTCSFILDITSFNTLLVFHVIIFSIRYYDHCSFQYCVQYICVLFYCTYRQLQIVPLLCLSQPSRSPSYSCRLVSIQCLSFYI